MSEPVWGNRCIHGLIDREMAVHDGMCPECLVDEKARLLELLADMVAEHRRSPASVWSDGVRARIAAALFPKEGV